MATSIAMVLRKVHRLRLASQENLEIARHVPELMGYPASRRFSLECLLTFTKSFAPLVSRDWGLFRPNDATATGTSLHVLSVLIAIIPTYLLCQMHGNSPEFEFQVTIFESRKRNIISSLPVYVLHKTRNKVFSRRSRPNTAKKCTKKRYARTKCLFCLLR